MRLKDRIVMVVWAISAEITHVVGLVSAVSKASSVDTHDADRLKHDAVLVGASGVQLANGHHQQAKSAQHVMRREKENATSRLVPNACKGYGSNAGDATLDLLSMLRPCARCASYKRMGSSHDGGYVLCSELLSATVGAYSFGINGDDSWGIDVTRSLAVPVFEFDCWHTERPKCSGVQCNLVFIEECLSRSKDFETDRKQESAAHKANKTARSLREHVMRNQPPGLDMLKSPEEVGNLLLKLDVEGAEWEALHFAEHDVLKLMSQIVVELHRLDIVECHAFFSSVVKKMLDAGFAVAHIHGNNHAPMDLFNDGEYMVPDELEVTFVNKHSFPAETPMQSGCMPVQDTLQEDGANNRFSLELPLAQLPNNTESHKIAGEEQHVVQCRYFCTVMQVSLRHRNNSLLRWTSALLLLVAVCCVAGGLPRALRAFHTHCVRSK